MTDSIIVLEYIEGGFSTKVNFEFSITAKDALPEEVVKNILYDAYLAAVSKHEMDKKGE